MIRRKKGVYKCTVKQLVSIHICNCITTDETKPILVSEKQKPSERGKLKEEKKHNKQIKLALRENKTLIFRVEK